MNNVSIWSTFVYFVSSLISSISSVPSVWSIQSIRSVPSCEDPILDLPLPWRERIEVRGSFVYSVHLVYLVFLVCFVYLVIARSVATKQSSCYAA